MAIIDDIRVHQDWTEDGYKFEKMPSDGWVDPFVRSEYTVSGDLDAMVQGTIVYDIKVENADSFAVKRNEVYNFQVWKANQDAIKRAIQKKTDMAARAAAGRRNKGFIPPAD